MIETYKSTILTQAGFSNHGFSTCAGGVSSQGFSSLNLGWNLGDSDDNVRENLGRLKSFLRTDAALARVVQVHKSVVVDAADVIEDGWNSPPSIEADALVSKGLGKLIGVQTADCVPVLLACPETKIVAAVHGGWRSLSKGIIRKTVRAMTERGAVDSKIIAALGPCICLKCYQVGMDVAKHFPESYDPIKGNPDKVLLDLGLAAEVSCISAGLSTTNIERIAACTVCQNDKLFSHRACHENQPCGRNLSFILS